MQIAFVMMAHAPYVRRPGRQPIGEEQLHELISRGLIPLVSLLGDLQATGLNPHLALACSPLLLEQLSDPVVQKHFVLWMEEQLAKRKSALQQFEAEGNNHNSYLANFYLEWERQALRSFEERFNRNLVARLRELAAARVIEPLSGAASHAYLPLLGQEESVRAQIEHGILNIARHLGRPDGVWLPGGGWRPGLEHVINNVGLRYVIIDPSSLPIGAAHQPTWVVQNKLAALCADEGIARHIWSPELGYVGDPLYRAPLDPGGYQAIGLDQPRPYDPYHALRRAQEHANHFVHLLVQESSLRGEHELLLILLDAALIGTSWFEGPTWLQAVLTLCATHPALKLTTPGEYMRTHRPQSQANLQAGSWGEQGSAYLAGEEQRAYWHAIHAAEARLVELAQLYPSADTDQERALNQAARELMLAQSSNWVEESPEDSNEITGWRVYLRRFHQLDTMIQNNTFDSADRFLLDKLEDMDGPFPNLNYRMFAP